MSEQKPREFTILLTEYGQHLWSTGIFVEAHSGWKRVTHDNPHNFGSGIHVIEKSYADSLEAEIKRLHDKYDLQLLVKKNEKYVKALNKIGMMTYGELTYTSEFQDEVRKVISEALKDQVDK